MSTGDCVLTSALPRSSLNSTFALQLNNSGTCGTVLADTSCLADCGGRYRCLFVRERHHFNARDVLCTRSIMGWYIWFSMRKVSARYICIAAVRH